MTRRLPHGLALTTGIIAVALPVLALMVKVLSPGWILVFLLVLSPLLLVGYGLQVAMAVSGFFASNGVFVTTRSWRAVVAAWVSSLGVVASGFFLVDSGDSGPTGSLFTQLFGGSLPGYAVGIPQRYATYEPEVGADAYDLLNLSTTISLIATLVWWTTYLWLVAEWIIAIVRARRRKREAAASRGEGPTGPEVPSA